jgi:ABC-type oligopeptide transport system substrate-binding subunit/DNA-binding SARP family transcriptional activator
LVPALRMYLLGTLDIHWGDQALPKPPTLKSQSLLAYLILHRRRPQPRDRLVGLFWADRPERKARSSLSTSLWHIRRCLPDEALILSDPHTVQFDPQADTWLDVEAFEPQATCDDIPGLESALALYRGDFLDGFYTDWIMNERYRLQALFLEALARLMAGYERRGNHQAALSAALRLLGQDPLREDAHRLAMRAYCRLGQRNEALEQYLRCAEIVQEELGAEPMVETIELYQAILEGRFAVGPAPESLPTQVAVVEPAPAAGRSPLDVLMASPLVGRDQELAFLHKCWQETVSRAGREAQAGGGGLVLIRGEAGVGKTRLVEEFASQLRWQAVRVLWGRCYEFERLLPYQPIAEALRSMLPVLTPVELADLPAWALGEVARLVPEVAEHFQDLEALASGDSNQKQARLFEGLTQVLAQLSSHGPLLIVLEDLHWATESTLGLTHYLARQLGGQPVLIVGTFRQEAVGRRHPLRELQGQLIQEGIARPLRLSRLSRSSVEAMVTQMSGAGESVLPLAARLYQETEGNPFFVMEMIKALFEMGLIRLEGGAWKGDFLRLSEGELPLPSGVSEAIRARFRDLDDQVQEALHLAAVLGREFDFDLLSAVCGRGEEATLEALDVLLRRRLIDEGSGSTGRDYAFTHHKIQEVAYAGMPGRHRGRLHAQVAAAMESLYRPEIEEWVGELALHFQQAQAYDKTLREKAITYLLWAGDRARGLYAHREAVGYYRRALALLKEQKAYERAARTLMKLGLTYHTTFDYQRARQTYQEGLALWQRAGQMEPTIPPKPAPHALRGVWYQVQTLDPGVCGGIFSGAVIDQLFSALVTLSPDMEIVPDVARSWEILEGGREYVFRLRDDVRWSDGVLVTAGDFAYAWKRVLDPATGSPSAKLFYDVKGARAFHQGRSGKEEVGVRALDTVTLAVELEEPSGYFLYLLASHATYPVPRHVVEARGEDWTRVGYIVTNGPFQIETWQWEEFMVLARNPEYHGQFGGNVGRVELTLRADAFAQWGMYEANELDLFFLWETPPLEIDRARQRHAGEYISGPWLLSLLLEFDVRRPPFDDPSVRRAFALSTNREWLADVVMRGLFSPASGGLVPAGMPGHSPGIGLPYDPVRACQLLAEAGYPGGCGLPRVDFLVPTGSVHEEVRKYQQTEWRKALGVHVAGETVEWAVLADRLNRNPPPMSLIAWMADYPDPDNFLRVNPIRRETGWRDETYDRLIEEARQLTDQGERMRLYQAADRILMEEAVVVPLLYYRSHMLVKPWVKRYPTSAASQWFWKDVIIEPH